MAKEGLFISVVADASKAINEFRKAEQGVKGVGAAAESTQTRMGKLSAIGSRVGSSLKRLALPAVAFGGLSVKAFGDAEKAAARMETSIENNRQLAGATVGEFQKLASAIQSKTAADDESILSGAAVLGNFKLTKDQIKDTLPLIVDYARSTGTDVPASASVVGKALLGNTRALKTLGINFKSTGDPAKDFAAITDLVRSKVGGFAEKEGKTTTGRLEIMKNKFNDLQEVVGGKLVAAFDFLSRNMAIIGPIIAAIVGAIITYKIVTGIATIVTALFGTTAGAAWAAAAGPIALLVAAVIGVGLVIWKFHDKFVAAFQAIVGFVKRFWPILLPIILGPIGLAIVGVIKHKDKIVGIFKAIVGGIKSAWSGITGFIGGVFDGIMSVIRTGINVVIHIINGLIRAYNLIPFHKDIPTLKTLAGPAQAVSTSGFGKTATLQHGGTVLKTGMAIVHEGETYSGVGKPLPGSGEVNIIFHLAPGSGYDEEKLATLVRKKFLELRRRTGPLGFA